MRATILFVSSVVMLLGWSSQPTMPAEAKPAAPDKAAPTHEQIAEKIADQALLRTMFDKHVQALPMKRIANLNEPIESRIARCAWVVVDGWKSKDADQWVKGTGGLGAAIFIELAKDRKYAETLLKNSAQDVTGIEEDLRETYDKWETNYHKKLAKQVDQIVRLAGVVGKQLPKELGEARKQMKEDICKAIAKNPDVVKAFLVTSTAPAELIELRNQGQALVEKATKRWPTSGAYLRLRAVPNNGDAREPR